MSQALAVEEKSQAEVVPEEEAAISLSSRLAPPFYSPWRWRQSRRDPDSWIHRSSSARSPADCQRASGSLDRHFLTTRSSAGGVIGASAERGRGSSRRIAAIRPAW